jgi:hypothetical protein
MWEPRVNYAKRTMTSLLSARMVRGTAPSHENVRKDSKGAVSMALEKMWVDGDFKRPSDLTDTGQANVLFGRAVLWTRLVVGALGILLRDSVARKCYASDFVRGFGGQARGPRR